jgi:hypothetical protein
MLTRTVIENSRGYKEVPLEFRIARATAMEEEDVGKNPVTSSTTDDTSATVTTTGATSSSAATTTRICCPVLDASRRSRRLRGEVDNNSSCPMLQQQPTSSGAPYGDQPLLKACTSDALVDWAEIMNIPPTATKIIAYISGPITQFPINFLTGTFDDRQVNDGLVRACKHNVHTGILSGGYFDQSKFDHFICTLYPHLLLLNEQQQQFHHSTIHNDKYKDDFQYQGQKDEIVGIDCPTIDNDYLYSSRGDDLYIGLHNIDIVLKHNAKQSSDQNKWFGPKMSKDEMVELLIGRLGQKVKGLVVKTIPTTITTDGEGPSIDVDDNNQDTNNMGDDSTVMAISVRDFHDLYKYGFFPAIIEDRFLKAGYIESDSIAMTGTRVD